MAEEKHHHHLFHHRKEEEGPGEVDYEKKEKHHKHMEQLGELGAIAAGAYALVRTKSNFFIDRLICLIQLLIWYASMCSCVCDCSMRSTRPRRTRRTSTATGSRRRWLPSPPWAPLGSPSTSTTRRRTPRSTATTD